MFRLCPVKVHHTFACCLKSSPWSEPVNRIIHKGILRKDLICVRAWRVFCYRRGGDCPQTFYHVAVSAANVPESFADLKGSYQQRTFRSEIIPKRRGKQRKSNSALYARVKSQTMKVSCFTC